MFQSLLLCSALLTCTIGPLQLSNPPVEQVLNQENSNMIIATVERKYWVVHPDKMTSKGTPLPDGKIAVELPKPQDYVVGSLYNVRVEQILKKGKGATASKSIQIFTPGFMASFHTSAPLLEGRKYLLFLELLNPEVGTFSDTKVHKLGADLATAEKFNPKSTFTVIQASNGALEITENNGRVIEEVKKQLSLPLK